MEVLYVYDHCPFCVKARMIFGLKNRPVDVKYLLNDDEKTPISMIGQKMVPILQEGNHFMGESMDIVHKIDQIDGKPILIGAVSADVAAWIERVGYISRLMTPRYVNGGMPEFATESARAYFIKKKEANYGSFDALLAETASWVAKLNEDLLLLEPLIQSADACNGTLSDDDIHLFAILRGISIVEGVIYPPMVNNYRKTMSQLSGVPLYHLS